MDVDRYYSFQAALKFSDLRHSLGHGGRRDGAADGRRTSTRNWSMANWVPQFRGTYDVGVALPQGHSSLWLRNAAGYSTRDRNDPFANFFLRRVRQQLRRPPREKRYREWYSYPGFGIDEISGQSFLRPMIEWNITPYVFESVGTPASTSRGCARLCSRRRCGPTSRARRGARTTRTSARRSTSTSPRCTGTR